MAHRPDTSPPDREPDWRALAGSEEFARLARMRRRFVVPALTLFLLWFGGFLALTAYAREFMATPAIGSVSWAYVLALSLIPMAWSIALLYVRFSDRMLAPLARGVAERDGDAPR